MPLVLLTATLLFGLARAPMPPQETTLPPPPPPTTTSALTTIPPTTIDPSSCEYEGKIYKNGKTTLLFESLAGQLKLLIVFWMRR